MPGRQRRAGPFRFQHPDYDRHHDAGRQRQRPRRRERQGLVRPLLRTRFRTRQALHGERVLRPAHGRAGHPRLARARQDARPPGHHRHAGSRRHRARDGTDRRRDRARRICLEPRRRGRAPEHREAPHRAGGRRGKTPAHRTQPQRPGRHRHPPVAARRDRPHPRADRRVPVPPARGRRNPCRHAPARLHPPAGGAAGHLRSPPDGLLRDEPARRRALRRLPQARQSPAARLGRARRHQLPDRPRVRRFRARLRRGLLQLARRRQRPRLRDRVLRRQRAAESSSAPPARC